MKHRIDKKGGYRRRDFHDGRDKLVFSEEVRKSISAFAVIPDLGSGKILLVHKSGNSPSWGLPGGGVDYAEKPAEGLRREVFMESGYTLAEEPQRVKTIEVNPFHSKVIFLAFVDARMRAPREKEEIDKAGWFSLPEIVEMPNLPYAGEDIEANVDYVKETHRQYILEVLEEAGLLEGFGFREAASDDCVDYCGCGSASAES